MKKMDRNEFFRTAGRLLMLGGIAATGIYLTANNQLSGSSHCKQIELCSSCGKFSGCKLSRADKFRKNEEREGK